MCTHAWMHAHTIGQLCRLQDRRHQPQQRALPAEASHHSTRFSLFSGIYIISEFKKLLALRLESLSSDTMSYSKALVLCFSSWLALSCYQLFRLCFVFITGKSPIKVQIRSTELTSSSLDHTWLRFLYQTNLQFQGGVLAAMW